MRKYIVICSLIAACVSLSACAAQSENTQSEAVTEVTTVYEMKDGDTVVTGEVSSIVGNEVTLSLGNLNESEDENENSSSESEENNNSTASDNAGGFSGNGEMPSFDSGNAPEMPSGEAPDFSGGDMPEMPSGDMSGNDFGGKKSSGSTITKSGETDTYIIPVGMTVSGLSGRSSDYSGISAGDILKITVDSDNTVKAVEVV